jgi:protein-disulfide isomerase
LVVLAAALLGGSVLGQAIGDDRATFLDATGAAETDAGGHQLGGLALDAHAEGGVLTGVTLDGALDEAGIADAAAALAIATGYGAGIEQPIASFLSQRIGDLAGQGPVTIGVEAYALELDVAPGAPPSARLTLTLPRVDAAAFGPPVASRGAADAPVVVREFSDFQCPACRRYATEILPGLESALLADDEVRFEFHHLPLASIHANAVPAAEAAQCTVDLFGEEAFWAYHDLLFERQAAWQGLGDPEPYFARLLQDVDAGLLGGPAADGEAEPEARLAACIENGDAREAVGAARERAAALRLSSTPTVFVGGYRLDRFGSVEGYARLARLHLAETAGDAADGGGDGAAE